MAELWSWRSQFSVIREEIREPFGCSPHLALQHAESRCQRPHQLLHPTRDVVSSPAGMSFSSLGSRSGLQAIKERGRKTTNFCLLLAATFQLIYGFLSLNLNCVSLVSAQPSGVKLNALLDVPASPLAPLPGRSGLAHLHSLHPTMCYKTDFCFIFFHFYANHISSFSVF